MLLISTVVALAVLTEPLHTQQNMQEHYVEFDFAPLPARVGRDDWKLTLQVSTTEKSVNYDSSMKSDDGFPSDTLAAFFKEHMESAGFQAEIVDKLKLRVHGCTVDGKFYPVRDGKASSPHVKDEQLPKVTVKVPKT